MSHKDLEFAELMQRLGVRPLDEEKGHTPDRTIDQRSLPQEPAVEREDPDRDLFLSSMSRLDVVPDKDQLLDSRSEDAPVRQKRKTGNKPDDCLDLHGKTVDEALRLLPVFIAESFARGTRYVIVITGKGKHSRGGVSVLKPAVERWILQKGRRFVASYAEAPRAYGGRGAFILNLKSK